MDEKVAVRVDPEITLNVALKDLHVQQEALDEALEKAKKVNEGKKKRLEVLKAKLNRIKEEREAVGQILNRLETVELPVKVAEVEKAKEEVKNEAKKAGDLCCEIKKMKIIIEDAKTQAEDLDKE